MMVSGERPSMTHCGVWMLAASLLFTQSSVRGLGVHAQSILSLAGMNTNMCPPPHVTPMLAEFNFTDFLAHPWYSQQQMTVIYQPERDLFCVRDFYRLLDARTVELKTKWKINGLQEAEFALHGNIQDPQRPTHLRVGLAIIPEWFRGPYWILDAGTRKNEPRVDGGYDWMMVSGGPPKLFHRETGRCRMGWWFNDSGLWLFTRQPYNVGDLVAEMRDRLYQLGYDLSQLRPVVHEGCDYDSAEYDSNASASMD